MDTGPGLSLPMKIIDLMHRWMGGLIGLLLAMLGLSGAILVHKDAWVTLPYADEAQVQDLATLSAALDRLLAVQAESVVLASRDFGLHLVHFGEDAGAYADQRGEIVARWESKWSRTELWLFDFHHYLWAGKTGAIVAGWLALIGIGFVVTGAILWWPLRKTFKFRLWPPRMSRPAILRQHRDFGIVVAPILFLSLLTGVMLTLRPVSNLLLAPWSSVGEMQAATAPPKVAGGPAPRRLDWPAMLREARQRFPKAEFRVLGLPARSGELVVLRMKQPGEWLPNGRTTVWFDPADGHIVDARDGLALPAGSRIFNMVYPLHAAAVGGLPYRIAMTASGLGLCLLGSLSVWSFWFRRSQFHSRRPPTS